MSKNLTRKGLALGAVVALGSTLLAGAPASAAPAITIAPAAGTSYSFLSGERFDVKVYGNSELTSGFGNLNWEVKNTSGTSVALTTTTSGSATADQNSTSSTDATITKTPASVGTTAGYNKLGLAVAADKEASYQVRAYLELDGTAGLTAGDLASQSETITFVKQANVTSSIAITSPVEGNTAVTASVRFNNINNEQLTNTEIGLGFTKGDGTDLDSTPSKVQKAVAAWSSTDGFVAATDAITALVKDTAVKVQAFYKNAGVAYTSTEKIGAAQTALVVARKAATITSDALASTSIKNTVTTGTATAKTNSTFVVRALVKDGATTPAAVAGASVSAVVTAAGLSTTKTLAVNGTTYTDSTKLPGQGSVAKLALTTDASGYASVTLTTTGFSAATGAITVAFTTENLAAVTETVDLADATYTAYALASNGDIAATTDGAAVSVPVVVYDQFGGVPADEYDVRAVFDATNAGYSAQATTAATSATSTFAALVGGKATLSILDNGTGAGVNTYDVTVEKRQSGGGYTGSSIAGLANFKVIIKDAADLVPGLITVTAGTVDSTTKISAIAGPVALNLNAYGAYDSRAVLGTAPTVGAEQSLAGNVKTAASATAAAVLVPGAKVTFSGTGLQFHSVVDSKDIYSLDSATVYADASGAFDVRVISNKAGKQTITVTSGAVSQVVTVVFADAAAGTATSLVVTAPATVAPGRTFDVSALLTDKYGNPVAVSTTSNVRVSYDGPGQVVGSLPTTFGTDGIAKFRVVLASNDSGSATVTVKYDSADGDFADTTDIVKTATITVAAPAVVEPTSKIGTANGRVYVNVKDGKGAVVSTKIGAKWFTRSALNNDYTLSFKSVKGKKVSVKVYVDGDLSASKTITVK